MIPDWAGILAALGGAVGVAVFWGVRERRLAAQRRRLQALSAAGEDVLGCSSPPEILNRLQGTLLNGKPIVHICMYVWNRGSNSLERVARGGDSDPLRVSVDSPLVACQCFRGCEMVLAPGDASPFLEQPPGNTASKAVIFAPMITGGEPSGVLELHYDTRLEHISEDESRAAQHLANLAGFALKQSRIGVDSAAGGSGWPASAPDAGEGRRMTVLLVEPDMATQRQLMALLSARGHRVVPVTTAGRAEEMCRRLAFDLVIGGPSVRGGEGRSPADRFVLLADWNVEKTSAVSQTSIRVLHKPVDPAEFGRLFEEIEDDSRRRQKP